MSLLIVASTNPVKINAAKLACEAMFPETTWETRGVSVPSGVPEQPMSSEEARQGAENRLNAIRQQEPTADIWIAFEGGVEDTPHGMSCFAWILIGRQGYAEVGQAKTGTIFLPPVMRKLILGGMELGMVDDHVFGQTNTKQKNGVTGLLTHDAIDRTAYYIHAAALAFATFHHPNLYSAPKD